MSNMVIRYLPHKHIIYFLAIACIFFTFKKVGGILSTTDKEKISGYIVTIQDLQTDVELYPFIIAINQDINFKNVLFDTSLFTFSFTINRDNIQNFYDEFLKKANLFLRTERFAIYYNYGTIYPDKTQYLKFKNSYYKERSTLTINVDSMHAINHHLYIHPLALNSINDIELGNSEK